MIGQNTATRLPLLLVDSFGVGVTGVNSAQIKSGKAFLTKGDGTTAFISIVDSGMLQNWYEIDPTNQPGLYSLILPSTSTNVLGKISITLYPDVGATFVAKMVMDEIGVSPSDFSLMKKVLLNNEIIDQGNALLRIYDDNGIDVVAEYYLQDSDSSKSIYNIRRKIRKS